MNVQVSTVVMMLVLGSLALIGIGTSILLEDNQREGLVGDYKEGVEAFAVAKGRFRRTTMTLQVGSTTVPLERFEGSEEIYGFTGDLPQPTAATYGWTASVVPAETFAVVQSVDSAAPPAGATITSQRMSVAVPSSTQLVCTPDDFDRNTGNCPDSFLLAQCHEISGDPTVGEFHKDPAVQGNCPRDNVICGTCDFNFYLNTRVEYVVWVENENRWRFIGNLGWPQYAKGVRYPFNLSEQIFSYEYKNPMNFTIKPLGDPYSVAQNVTEGGMNFGRTLDDQRRDGLIMIATGSVTFILCVASIVGMRYMAVKSQKKKDAGNDKALLTLPSQQDSSAIGGVAVNVDQSTSKDAGNTHGNGGQQQQQNNSQGNNNGNGGNANGNGGGDANNSRNPIEMQNKQGWNNNTNGDRGGWNTNGNQNNGGQSGWNSGGNQGGGWNNNQNGGDEDFRATDGPGNRYNRNNHYSGGGGGNNNNNNRRSGGGGLSRNNNVPGNRRNSSGDGGSSQGRNSRNSGGGGGGGSGSNGGGNNNSGQGSWKRSSGNDDSRSQHSANSAQVAQALRRGPGGGGGGGGQRGNNDRGGGGGGGRHRSNSRGRRQNNAFDDPDL